MKLVSLLFLISPLCSFASERSSASYTIETDITDSGGEHASSATYTNNGSIVDVGGVSSAISSDQAVNHGYIGQLYEVIGLSLSAPTLALNENDTQQLSAAQLLDDETLIELAATAVDWSVASGPLTGIDTNGLATAGTVYQNTAASAQGDYAGFTGTLDLNVLDNIPDNFGSYAGDGLDDDWQFLYFDLNNPQAAPLLDPDSDGQNNLFEFTAGLVPTDSLSRFMLRIEPIPSEPQQKNLVFEPLIAGRTYTVLRSRELSPASWSPLAGSPLTSNSGSQRTVTDTTATESTYFYRVEITKP